MYLHVHGSHVTTMYLHGLDALSNVVVLGLQHCVLLEHVVDRLHAVLANHPLTLATQETRPSNTQETHPSNTQETRPSNH